MTRRYVERRRSPRVRADHTLISMMFGPRDERRCGVVGDLAAGGLFVLTDDAPPIGKTLDIELLIADELHFATTGVVVRDDTGERRLGKRRGFALELRDLTRTQRVQLADLVDALAGRPLPERTATLIGAGHP